MCLSTAFKGSADGEKILEYISEVKVDGDRITLTDIMGRELTVEGFIRSMDFVNSKIIIG